MPRPGTGVHGRLVEPYRLTLDRYRTRLPPGGDSDIAALVCGGSAHAFQAVVVRHRRAVVAYLHTCTTDPAIADNLVERTFSCAVADAARGASPVLCWRVHLLATARGLVLREWLRRPDGPFRPGFRRWAEAGAVWSLDWRPRLTEAYRRLPERWRTALWHGIVEGDDTATASACLGIRREEFGPLMSRARQALHGGYLELHQQAAHPSAACTRRSALLAASAESGPVGAAPERRQTHGHIADHLADCAPCRAAYEDLADLDGQLRAQLPPLLLGWWPGAEYRAVQASLPAPEQPPAFLREAVRITAPAQWWDTALRRRPVGRRRMVYLATATVGVCLAMATYDSLVQPPGPSHEDAVTPASDQAEPHSDTGKTEGLGGGREPIPPSLPPKASPRTPSPTAPHTKPPKGPSSPPAKPLPTHPGDATPQLLDAGKQIRADAYTLQADTSPQADGSVDLPGGSRLRFDNVDFGDRPKTMARLRLTVGAPGSRLALRFDDSATAAATLSVPASGQAQTVELPLPEGQAGVHSLNIEASCTDAGPCVSLSTLSFE